MKKAVFFDRDGVLNEDNGFVKNVKDIRFYPETSDAVAFVHNNGFLTFIVSNQTVVARGLMTENQLVEFNKEYLLKLKEKNENAIINHFYYCPHHPNASNTDYRVSCSCRKPKPGMILLAAKQYNVDLKKSYMVGDRISDIVAGYNAGCKTIQVYSGKHDEKMIETDFKIDKVINPDFCIQNLKELEKIIS